MRVICFCTYLTEIGSAWRPDDFNAHDFIHAIKDRDINKYAYVPVGGNWHRFDNSNRQEVVRWFARMVADYVRAEALEENMILVPVPGSRCDVSFAGRPRTATLAVAIAEALDGSPIVRDILRWKTVMPSSNSEGGTRDPEVLFNNLVATGRVCRGTAVLVDDVFTSGGHLQACAAVLLQHGTEVEMAFVAGRADDLQPDKPFALRLEDLPPFSP